MRLRDVTAARERLRNHMKGTGYEMAQDKMDVTLWRENPLVIVEMTVHAQCGQCYGIISEIAHAGGFSRIEYDDEYGGHTQHIRRD